VADVGLDVLVVDVDRREQDDPVRVERRREAVQEVVVAGLLRIELEDLILPRIDLG